MASIVLIYIVVGLGIGFLSGLIGIGGGLITVPALAWVLTQQHIADDLVMHIAIATSLTAIVFTSLAAVKFYHCQKNIVWKAVKILLPGIIIGSVIGVIISGLLSTHHLRTLFGIFIFIISFRLLFGEKTNKQTQPLMVRADWMTHALALTAGFFAGLLGIGGALIIIPYLLYKNFSMREASGTAVACSLPIALIGVVSFIVVSAQIPNLPPFSTGYINWPAVIGISFPSIFSVSLGAKLGSSLSHMHLKKFFAIFLIFVGINMFYA